LKPANSAITNEEKTAVASAQLESGDKISNKATPLKSPDSAIKTLGHMKVVLRLQMNRPRIVLARQRWVPAGLHPAAKD
jgi:hypothetical protein